MFGHKVGGECWNMISDIAITLVAKDDMLAILVGGLEHECYFSIDWEWNNHPNRRSPSFFHFSEGWLNHQPDGM